MLYLMNFEICLLGESPLASLKRAFIRFVPRMDSLMDLHIILQRECLITNRTVKILLTGMHKHMPFELGLIRKGSITPSITVRTFN